MRAERVVAAAEERLARGSGGHAVGKQHGPGDASVLPPNQQKISAQPTKIQHGSATCPKNQRHGSATCPARSTRKLSEYSSPPASTSRREPGPARLRPTKFNSGDKAGRVCHPSCHRIQRPNPRRPSGQKPRIVPQPADATRSARHSHPNGALGRGRGRQRAWLSGSSPDNLSFFSGTRRTTS